MQGYRMGTTFEGYVLDNDLLGAILRTVKGIDASEDALSFEVIRDTVMGAGHYLGHPQTFDRMRTDYVYPEIADRRSIGEWEKAGSRDAREIARDRARAILAEHYPRHISQATDTGIRSRYSIILPEERMRAGNGVW